MMLNNTTRTVLSLRKGKNSTAALLLLATILATGSASGAPLVRSLFSPTDDAHVKSGFSAKKNFGRETILELHNNRGAASEVYFKFTLAGADPNIKEARLRIYATAEKAQPATILVGSTVAASWMESTITWKDKPEQFNSIGKIQVNDIAPAWYEVDLTTFVKTELAARNHTISLVLLAGDNSNNKISIRSLEAESNAPHLVIGRALFTAKIIFQPKDKTAPAGYITDFGAPFGPRPNGMDFGWNTDVSAFVQDRSQPAKNDPKPARGPDVRYMGVAFMDHAEMKSPALWEIAVPNGKYKAHLVAGDASYDDSIYTINVENVTVIDGIPEFSKRWVEGTQIVEVTDGKLTVQSHPKGINNKLCFLEIAEVARP